MRIVVAGGGGFASLLVRELSQTPHAILVLSQSGRPELEELYDCQVAMVDYRNTDALRFILQGANLVISTIPGAEQLSLIEASRAARVDRFIPSEFEGLVSQRPMPEYDPYSGKGSAEARALLRRYSRSKSAPLNYTIFSCGMFYERFGPGGLQASGMGASFEILGQRDCMIDLDHGYAQVPTTGPNGRAVNIALTSAYDVARLVVAALDLGINNWPHEFKMYGTRIPTVQLSQICSETMGVPLDVRPMSYEELLLDLQLCSSDPDRLVECFSLQHLLQTANGRYFMTSDGLLNTRLSMRLMTFHEWLLQVRGMQ